MLADDVFAVGALVGVSADAPYLDSAYKMVAYDGRPAMRLSVAKVSVLGAEQVYRLPGRADIAALRDEPAPRGGQPLLEDGDDRRPPYDHQHAAVEAAGRADQRGHAVAEDGQKDDRLHEAGEDPRGCARSGSARAPRPCRSCAIRRPRQTHATSVMAGLWRPADSPATLRTPGRTPPAVQRGIGCGSVHRPRPRHRLGRRVPLSPGRHRYLRGQPAVRRLLRSALTCRPASECGPPDRRVRRSPSLCQDQGQ